MNPILGAENFDIFHDKARAISTMETTSTITTSADNEGRQEESIFKYNTFESSMEIRPKKAINERRLLWKIDLCLLPLLLLCYTLQYLDKGSLAFSALLGIIEDNNLVGQQYSWTNSIFFFGYLVFSYPTSVLIVKFPIGKYVSATVIVWSVILMLHAACHNFSGLMAVRFFLGVGEATVAPAMALLIGTFYKREEQALRQCAFFVGDGIAGIAGGLIAYAVGHINGKIAVWKYLFLIYGAVTIFWGIILFFTLPDSPSTARFLTPEERVLAAQRVAKEGSKKKGDYKKYQVIEALKDPQAWLLIAHTFCVNIATGGLSGFGNLLIQGFGFTLFQSILLTIPGAVSQIIFMGIGAYLGTCVKNARLYAMIFFMVVSITGTVMMWKIPAEHKVARMAGACLTAAFSANLPMSLSMVTSNIVGFTKKSTVVSMVFVAYCVGRIIGPQFFRDNEAPHYETGLKAILSVFSLAAFFAIVLRVYLMRENTRRDKEAAAIGISPNSESESIDSIEEEEDLTDRELKNFRYLL